MPRRVAATRGVARHRQPAQSRCRPGRAFAEGMHGTQAGDPQKAATAIEAALRAGRTPLRLQLGADAIAAMRGHAEALLAELAAWEAVGAATARAG